MRRHDGTLGDRGARRARLRPSSWPTTTPTCAPSWSGPTGSTAPTWRSPAPLGIEALPPDAGRPLLDAWHEGAAALPSEFGAWAAPCLSEAGRRRAGLAARSRLRRGVPARRGARDEAGFDGCGPLLEVLEERGAPLFVHPGPAPGTLAGAGDRRRGRERAVVVARAHQLRGGDERRLARVRGASAGPRTRGCGSASRCWPASRRSTASVWSRAAGRTAADPDVVPRHLVVRAARG